MPRTIEEGFRDFLTKLTPSDAESEAAKRHRASIEACLKANLNSQRFFRTGSFGNGTSISGYSDVDYFAVIPTDRLKRNSATTLAELRATLESRFPNTGVNVDCPSVCLPFGASPEESTELTPADLIGTTSEQFPVYDIPDCSGGWMRSSPDAHNAYVRDINEKLGGKIKPLIRFMKAWKYYMQVPISSFYIELRVTKYAADEKSIVYYIDLRNVLAMLSNCKLADMYDPKGISGTIHACTTQAKLDEARSKLDTALTRAENAYSAQVNGDTKMAFAWLSLLYDDKFPSYYR